MQVLECNCFKLWLKYRPPGLLPLVAALHLWCTVFFRLRHAASLRRSSSTRGLTFGAKLAVLYVLSLDLCLWLPIAYPLGSSTTLQTGHNTKCPSHSISISRCFPDGVVLIPHSGCQTRCATREHGATSNWCCQSSGEWTMNIGSSNDAKKCSKHKLQD